MNIEEIAKASLAKGNRSFLKPEEVDGFSYFIVVRGRTQEFDSDFEESGKRTAILADVDCYDSEGNVVEKITLDVNRWQQTLRYFTSEFGMETDDWEGKKVLLMSAEYTDKNHGGVIRKMIVPQDTKGQAKAEGC